jgi:hypothetical protein
MSEIIDTEIAKLKEDYPRLSGLADEYLFSLICFKYFYNNGKFDYSDYMDCFVDGKSAAKIRKTNPYN